MRELQFLNLEEPIAAKIYGWVDMLVYLHSYIYDRYLLFPLTDYQ